MIIGRVSSTAVQPYYSNSKTWGPFVPFPVASNVLAELLLRGKVLAGPVSSLDYVRLIQEGCTRLSDFGVFLNPYVVNQIDTAVASGARAALIHAPYVMLLRRPIEEYDSLNIGISEEVLASGTEALLLAKILLAFYWELPHQVKGELSLEDDAWIVRGGPYLQMRSRNFFGFPFAYDLSWEWYHWRKTPYLFYRWVCAPNIEEGLYQHLIVVLRRTLEGNLCNLSSLASYEAGVKGLERSEMLTYLQGFGYRLGLWEKPAELNLYQLANLLKDPELHSLS